MGQTGSDLSRGRLLKKQVSKTQVVGRIPPAPGLGFLPFQFELGGWEALAKAGGFLFAVARSGYDGSPSDLSAFLGQLEATGAWVGGWLDSPQATGFFGRNLWLAICRENSLFKDKKQSDYGGVSGGLGKGIGLGEQ